MKTTGMVRRLDELGRIVLPVEMRRTLQMQEGDPVEILSEKGGIFLKKYRPGCVICGSEENLAELDGIRICRTCADKLAELHHAGG